MERDSFVELLGGDVDPGDGDGGPGGQTGEQVLLEESLSVVHRGDAKRHSRSGCLGLRGDPVHGLIAEIAKKIEILILIWDMLANLIQKARAKSTAFPGPPKKPSPPIKRFFLALKAKDPRKAVEAMKQHMLDEEKALVAALLEGKSGLDIILQQEKRRHFHVLITTKEERIMARDL